jgi:Arc/MetJ-type ribon-helix-helix transcriptional regulator
MKHKIAISVDEETLDLIQEKIKIGKFRNRSHAFEYAIKEISKEVFE